MKATLALLQLGLLALAFALGGTETKAGGVALLADIVLGGSVIGWNLRDRRV